MKTKMITVKSEINGDAMMDFLSRFLRNFPVAWYWIFAGNDRPLEGLQFELRHASLTWELAEKSINHVETMIC